MGMAFAAALLALTYINLATLPHGYTDEGVVLASVRVHWRAPLRTVTEAEQLAYVRQLTARLQAAPELANPAVATGTEAVMGTAKVVAGAMKSPVPAPRIPTWFVTANYFSLLQIPVVEGSLRRFDPGTAAVAIDRAAAMKLFGTPHALGRMLTWASRAGESHTGEIEAIVGDVRGTFPDRPGGALVVDEYPHVYTAALPSAPISRLSVLTRIRPGGRSPSTALDAAAYVDGAAVQSSLASLASFSQADGQHSTRLGFQLLFAAIFGVASLAIALFGISAFMLSHIAARRHELAVRVALGDSALGLFRRVLAETARLAATGAAFGLVVAWWGAAGLRSLLFGVSPLDWRILAAVAALSVLAATLAGIGPAARAASTDPNSLLKDV